MGFVNGLKWVQKWVKSGFSGAKVGQNASQPTFAPTINPLWLFHDNPPFTQFEGVKIVFQKGPWGSPDPPKPLSPPWVKVTPPKFRGYETRYECNCCDPSCLVFFPISGRRPEIRKRENIGCGLWPPHKIGKNSRKLGQWPQIPIFPTFGQFFPFFGYFFPVFRGRPKPVKKQPGKQDRNASVSVQPNCSHRYVSLKEFPLKPVLILKHAARISTEQTSVRTKWFKHIAMQTVQELSYLGCS